jgi:hypothetical protein
MLPYNKLQARFNCGIYITCLDNYSFPVNASIWILASPKKLGLRDPIYYIGANQRINHASKLRAIEMCPCNQEAFDSFSNL